MRMTVAAVSASPAMMARWIGAAPRQRGSAEACRLRQPSRGRRQHGLRQDQAVGDDDADVGAMGRERTGLRLGLQAGRGERGQPVALGQEVDRRLPLRHAAPGGPRRLSIDGRDRVPRRQNAGKRRNGEIGRAHEDDAQH